MKPRKLKILKDAIHETEDPLSITILEGLIKLFEWKDKMKEFYPSFPDITDIYDSFSADHCPGYFCTFSQNYMIEDETAAKPFEAPRKEIIRDVFDWSMASICPYIRDLAYIYRKHPDVRDMVDQIIHVASSDANEKRTFRNVLSRAAFMSDFEREKLRNAIIRQKKV